LDRITFVILCAVVALAPLPFGSTDPATIAVWCIVLGAAVIVAPLRRLARGHFLLLGGIAVIVAAYALVLHEQLSAHPWLPVATPHPLWREAGEALGIALEPSVSIARNQPFWALGAPLAAMLALICGLTVGADRRDAHRLLRVIAWSGVAYAVYGIAAYIVDPTKILWRDKIAYQNVLTATFINRNTAAPYFGTCAVIWLVLLSDDIRRRLPPGPIAWRKLPKKLFSNTPRRITLAFSMLFVCLAAMFMTGSRAGVVLSLLALVIAFTLFFRRDLPRRTGVLTAVLGAGAMALVLLQFMGAGVNARFDAQGAADGGRFGTYLATLRMIGDHPWLGTGIGTFAWAYPAYRPADVSLWGVWDRAHDTLLEIAADMGIPYAALVVGRARPRRGQGTQAAGGGTVGHRAGPPALAGRFSPADPRLRHRRLRPGRRRAGAIGAAATHGGSGRRIGPATTGGRGRPGFRLTADKFAPLRRRPGYD
jgi:hypothetical protein